MFLFVVIVAITATDIGLSFTAGCYQSYVSNETGEVYLCGYTRWSRPLRGFLLLGAVSSLAKEAQKVILAVPRLVDVTVLLVYVIGIFAFLMTELLSDTGNDAM